jgi:hypothetical protein
MKKYLLTIVLISSILSAQETKNKLENANNKNEIVNSTTTTSENYNKENLKDELDIYSCFKNCYDNFCKEKEKFEKLNESYDISSICYNIELITGLGGERIKVSTSSTEKEFINSQYELCNSGVSGTEIFLVKEKIEPKNTNYFSNFGKNFVACLTPCIQKCDIVKQYKQKIEDEEKLKKKTRIRGKEK